MGTRAAIVLKTEDKEYVIYNQFDGYLSSAGLKSLEIATKAESIKKALKEIEIFSKSEFKNQDVATKFEDRVKSFELFFPEWAKEVDEKQFSSKHSFRLYDFAPGTILGLATGETNFLVTETMEEISQWIDYSYTIDLDNQTVTEHSRGFFFDKETCLNYESFTRNYMDKIDEGEYYTVRHPEEQEEDEEYLSKEELNKFLIKKV